MKEDWLEKMDLSFKSSQSTGSKKLRSVQISLRITTFRAFGLTRIFTKCSRYCHRIHFSCATTSHARRVVHTLWSWYHNDHNCRRNQCPVAELYCPVATAGFYASSPASASSSYSSRSQRHIYYSQEDNYPYPSMTEPLAAAVDFPGCCILQ